MMNFAAISRAAFAALCLTAALAPVANAAVSGRPAMTHRAGPYDNTGNGPQQSGLEGGGG
jgi:hypothetical protein